MYMDQHSFTCLSSIPVDVRKIVPSDILSDSLVNGIAKVSNTKNFKVVTNPVGVKVGQS